jgi:hypothetical protein
MLLLLVCLLLLLAYPVTPQSYKRCSTDKRAPHAAHCGELPPLKRHVRTQEVVHKQRYRSVAAIFISYYRRRNQSLNLTQLVLQTCTSHSVCHLFEHINVQKPTMQFKLKC